ncbi:MAG: hypothetical protein ACOYON_06270 [Fimbriimonas sp.]
MESANEFRSSRRDLVKMAGGLALGSLGLHGIPIADLAQEEKQNWSGADLLAVNDVLFDVLAAEILAKDTQAVRAAIEATAKASKDVRTLLNPYLDSGKPGTDLARASATSLGAASLAAIRIGNQLKKQAAAGQIKIADPLEADALDQNALIYLATFESAARILVDPGSRFENIPSATLTQLRALGAAMLQASVPIRQSNSAYRATRGRVQVLITKARAAVARAIQYASATPPDKDKAKQALAIARSAIANAAEIQTGPVPTRSSLDAILEGASRSLDDSSSPELLLASTDPGVIDLKESVWNVLTTSSTNASNMHRSYFTWSVWFFAKFLSKDRRASLHASQVAHSVPRLALKRDPGTVGKDLADLLS